MRRKGRTVIMRKKGLHRQYVEEGSQSQHDGKGLHSQYEEEGSHSQYEGRRHVEDVTLLLGKGAQKQNQN